MLGSSIKKYLDDRGIKYTYLVEKTGLSLNVISPILNNRREIKANEYFLICKALNVPLETFANKE